jgi:ParB family transcriptional regulator, chromosome partitioning protein
VTTTSNSNHTTTANGGRRRRGPSEPDGPVGAGRATRGRRSTPAPAAPGSVAGAEPAGGPDGAAGPAGGGGVQAGWVLEWVDPVELVVGVNTRTVAALNRGFVGSIADRGVREPITVCRDERGRLVVRTGQRRALAAVQADLRAVPVIIQPDPAAGTAAGQVERIVDQLVENQHRQGLPEADEVAAHQQLLELGLTAGQIARRTRTTPRRVRTTIAVAGSELAVTAMARGQVSLEQAAVIAEFNDPDITAALVAAAHTGQFEHVAQRARDARAEQRLRQRLTTQLAAAGITVVDRPDPHPRRGTAAVRPLNQLRAAADTPPGTELTEHAHTGCPGHVAWLEHTWHGEEPLRTVYGCQQWRQYGHAELHAHTTPAGPTGATPEGWSAERTQQRREVIASNKAWASATTVRRAWLHRFLTRKHPPKDAPQWIAATLAAGSHDLRRAMEDRHRLAAHLLNPHNDEQQTSPRHTAHAIADAARTANPARATTLTLAILLAALEAGIGKDTWRHPTRASADYLRTLHTWGYQLSDLETHVATTHQHDQDPTDNQNTQDAAADPNGEHAANGAPDHDPGDSASAAPGANTDHRDRTSETPGGNASEAPGGSTSAAPSGSTSAAPSGNASAAPSASEAPSGNAFAAPGDGASAASGGNADHGAGSDHGTGEARSHHPDTDQRGGRSQPASLNPDGSTSQGAGGGPHDGPRDGDGDRDRSDPGGSDHDGGVGGERVGGA